MAAKHHNLRGWLRDVADARRNDRDLYQELEEFIYNTVCDLEAMADEEAAGSEDDDEDADDGGTSSVDSAEPDVRQQVLPGTGGPAARSDDGVAPTGGIPSLLASLARQLGSTPERVIELLRADPVGRAPRRLKMPTQKLPKG